MQNTHELQYHTCVPYPTSYVRAVSRRETKIPGL